MANTFFPLSDRIAIEIAIELIAQRGDKKPRLVAISCKKSQSWDNCGCMMDHADTNLESCPRVNTWTKKVVRLRFEGVTVFVTLENLTQGPSNEWTVKKITLRKDGGDQRSFETSLVHGPNWSTTRIFTQI